VRSLSAYASEQQPLGFFRVFATPPGGYQREITLFRGAPVKVSTVSTQDPFTEVTAAIAFPQITVFDTPGEGDLDWFLPNTDIDIIFENTGGYDFDWRWEGYIAAYNFSLSGSDSGFNADIKGALYGLDDYLAIPQFPKQPIPHEILIAQAFDQTEHPTHLGKFRVLFPDGWAKKVPPNHSPDYLSALKPWGVATGQRWTGFTSRNTGSWEPVLTGFTQTLLSNMFEAGGSQWSIRNRGHRRPELFLRRIPDSQDDRIIEITLGAPGVTLDGSRDYTQRAGVIYGAGKDFAGIEFSNIQVSPDGRKTFYEPYAYSPRMYPRKRNPRFDPRLKPVERQIRFVDGIDEISATAVAQAQFQRFAEPGITGTITLTTDPRTAGGHLVPRLLIRAGSTLRINGLLGVREGVLAHITECTADLDALTTQLTFDTKYRDQLTVAEVKARTRDSLVPMRALQVGKYSNTINDLVLPWSYTAGSGIIPTPAKEFFTEKITDPKAQFPFEEWTKKFPPSSHPGYYVKIGPTDRKYCNNNWSAVTRGTQQLMSIPIRMSQAGSIRLSQLAAYDRNGNVMPVKFHLSVYTSNGSGAMSAPQFPGARQLAAGGPNPDFPKYLDARRVDGTVIPTTYESPSTGKVGNQAHPFYKGGWEKVQPDGTQFPWGKADPQLANASAGFIVGWGNFYEPAGYSPGRFSKGASRTGLLEDDATWTWNIGEGFINLDTPEDNKNREWAGMLFVLIYCDDQDDKSVYFMGRFIRQEPGQS
jgi:hypothetical protein